MIIIGNENIVHNTFVNINSIDDIQNTKANSVVIFTYDINIIKYTNYNAVNSAVIVNDIKEAIFCNALGVDYIIVNNDISKSIQSIAQNYMFDSKVLEIINSDDDIEDVALNEIDGCIYNSLLKGKSS